MAKQSGFLKRLAAQRHEDNKERDHFVRVMCQDMALLALADTFGFGEDRLRRFADAYAEMWSKWARATLNDAKDDKDAEYSREKYEEKMRQICGKYYVPREERYK